MAVAVRSVLPASAVEEMEDQLRAIEARLPIGVEIETSRRFDEEVPHDCETCDGSGEVVRDCMDCDGCGVTYADCETCNGTGRVAGEDDADEEEPCPDCDGTGSVKYECETCEGEGRITDTCDDCGGCGYTSETCEDSEVVTGDAHLHHTWQGHSEHCGHEFVSEVMRGENAIRDAVRVSHLANRYGEESDSGESVGLHVHVSVRGLTAEDVTWLWQEFRTRQEDIYRAFEVDSTRAECWCQPLDYSYPCLSFDGDNWQFDARYAYGGHVGRYYGLNLLALQQHGTVEFRLFNGGESAQYIRAAIEFARRFVALARLIVRPTEDEVTALLRPWVRPLSYAADEAAQ